MTHPLTPREKVAQLIDEAPDHQTADELADAILTALASSGDHAELERLADRNVELSVLAYKWMEAHDALKSGQPYDYPSPADVPTLLAENAALRERNECLERVSSEQSVRVMRQATRATEAGRKLAEADRLLDRAADLMRQCTDPERFEGASTLNVYVNMRAWLSDLSKEAERG